MGNQQSNHRTALLLGGIATGIVAGRLIPPLVSGMKSASRVRSGGDPFELLLDDHRRILRSLDDMVSTPAGSKIRRSWLFLALKRRLAKHAMAEEDVVYPLVRKQMANEDQGKHLYDEHAV